MIKHIHLYRRVDLVPKHKQINTGAKPYLVYLCQKPNCNHSIPVNQGLNKVSECNKCRNPFIMDKYALTLAKPKCQKCIDRQVKSEVMKINELLEDIEL